MSHPTLTVVIPAHNSSGYIDSTLEALAEAVGRSPFQADVVLVDDGSSDDTGRVAVAACSGRLPLSVLSQQNRGRFEARRAGLNAARGEWVLLLDSRVTMAPEALAHVSEHIETNGEVWNAHVHVLDRGNPFGVFWRLLAELAWRDYFDDPRDVSYGIADFDRFPKGTTCFLARRQLLLAAVDEFRTGYSDVRSANDDTRLIRWIAARRQIHLSPRFACAYQPRTTLPSFFRHAIHRGVVFLDGHSDVDSRYRRGIIAFYPVSAALTVLAVRRPTVAPATLAVIGVAAASFASVRGRTTGESLAFALAAPVYAVGHGLGMWKGLAMMARRRVVAR